MAYERATGKRLWTAPVNGAPDNLSITAAGRLLVTAQLVDLVAIRDQCLVKNEAYCGLPFAVYSLDAANGEVTPIFEAKGAPFGGATVAVQSGAQIYLGAFAGKRIARIPAP